MMRSVLFAATAVALAGLGLSATPAEGQAWNIEPAEPGWIGISFQVDTDHWGRTSAVTITDVRPGSPAHEGGVRPGDRLLAINDLRSPEELARLTERLRLRAGDTVVMEVARAGARHRLRLRAEERPVDVDFGRRIEVTYATDDQVESWVRSMDSLRIELVRGGGQTVRIRTSSDDAGERVAVLGPVDGARSVQAPFEFFVFRGESHDSLKREMVELNRVTSELQVRMRERERQVRLRIQGDDPVHLAEDDELRRLSDRLDEVGRRSARLETAMAEAARESAELEYVARAARPAVAAGVGSTASPTPAPASPEFRPLTPYLLGRNRVAGAEVVDLKPELATYFQVEGGGLVVDVAPATPAALAGIVPGDVIVGIDQADVRSVEDLRFGVSSIRESVPVELIRRGEVRRVELHR